MKSNINDNDYEITVNMLEQMNDLTDSKIDDIINSEKGAVLPEKHCISWVLIT